jgi:hypothetical protein
MASFAQDIRPLFREKDVRSMSFAFDLNDYDQVKTNADEIYEKLISGEMPCDGAWSQDRVALFKQWMDGGYAA